MNEVLFSALAFVVALGALVTVHEFGHYWVARKVGVKVLRFSIGFGKPLWSRQHGETEFVVAAIPLGGYVRMLDEREGEVAPQELSRAFNRKSLARRSAVVVAGPLFNFLFALAAYWLMYMTGVPGVRPVVGEVSPASVMAQAGLQYGDEVIGIGRGATPTWESVLLATLDATLAAETTTLRVRSADGGERRLTVDFAAAGHLLQSEGQLLQELGMRPWYPPLPAVLGRLVTGGAAEQAGLLPGDRILSVDGVTVPDWEYWADYVRNRPGQAIRVGLQRDGRDLELDLAPAREVTEAGVEGRVGVWPQRPDDYASELRVLVRHGPLAAMGGAVERVWSMSGLTLRTLWSMLTGRATLKNISGPISIAQYAGYTASSGLASFLGFLALVSISLGILNLLPVPVLDGGHLLYFAIEWIRGGPLSEQAQAMGQQVGITLLVVLMGLAMYNDLTRLFN